MNEQTFLRKKDFFIIITIVAVAVAYFIIYKYINNNNNGDVYAEIISNGEVVETHELNKNNIFSIDQLPNVVFEIKDNSIAFISSDCPDKICIHEGFLNKSGQMAACLPNKVVLKMVSKTKVDEIDAVVQ